MKPENGTFTVSLDFELYWGVRDKGRLAEYTDNLRGVRKAVPEILKLFSDNGIHATWATVGFLFFESAGELKENIPKTLPKYRKLNLSPYKYIENTNDLDPICHFAPELIELILKHDGQEIGTHTFSHYYCLEEGQSLAEFEDDINYAVKIAKDKGITIKSLVFPRNQFNKDYLSALNKFGVQCYRGNESSWLYQASDDDSQSYFRGKIRLIDFYLNLSGHNTYHIDDCTKEKPFNFPSSRFLRPYSDRFAILNGLRLRRIKKAMDDAAMNNRIFHLWFHPHNFGVNTEQNVSILVKIIEHYTYLKKNYGMKSLNMGELFYFTGIGHEK